MPNTGRNALILGVTGGIACGKSEVGRILGEMGFSVCDADVVAHNLMAKGAPAFQKVVDHFGSGILSEEGEISRPALGHIVFEHPEQRSILNRLVHPAVRKALAEWIGQMQAEGRRSAVLLPLLFESGMQDLGWTSILCVSSREADAIQRLEQRGLSRDESEKRLHSQMPLAEKERLADHVVPNVGTLDELKWAVRRTVEAIVVER